MRDVVADVAERLAAWLSNVSPVALSAGRAGNRTTTDRRLLMLDDLVPDPLFGAGYPRAAAIVRSLVDAGFTIDFFPMEATASDLERMRAQFPEAVQFHPADGVRALRRILQRDIGCFDAVIISRPRPMQVFKEMRWSGTKRARTLPVLYDAEAVLAPREVARRHLFGPSWSADEYRAALESELALARSATAIMAVSAKDVALIGSVIEVPVFVVPHPVSIRSPAPGFAERRDLLFVGRLAGVASASPNVDSIMWFTTTVMPHLDALIGDAFRVHLVGYVESPEIMALASDRIVLHGVVDDLGALYDSCRLFIAPTRYAAGIPIKLLEAMGAGIPCVATPLLAEQLAAGEGAVATGSDPADFAAHCARLYTTESAWIAARDGGRDHVQRFSSPARFTEALGIAVGHVVSSS